AGVVTRCSQACSRAISSMVASLRRAIGSEADRADIAAHIAEFGNDSINRRYALKRPTSDLDAITRLPALDLVLGLVVGKRSDIYSWDVRTGTPKPGGVGLKVRAKRSQIQKQQSLVAGRERLERLPA